MISGPSELPAADSLIYKIETCEKVIQARSAMINVVVQSNNRPSTKSVSVQTDMCFYNTDFDFESASRVYRRNHSTFFYIPSEFDSHIDEKIKELACFSEK